LLRAGRRGAGLVSPVPARRLTWARCKAAAKMAGGIIYRN
jgi:hypothetical protein